MDDNGDSVGVNLKCPITFLPTIITLIY